jgi:DNA-binding NarL/FixJ family response regulator
MRSETRGADPKAVPPVRVFLLDDQAIIRAALKSLLDERQDIEVVGDSGQPRTALEEIRRLRPDVLVLDITMPELSGLDLLPMVRKSLPRTKVVMLTHHEGESFVERALKGGADGYLSKDSDPAELAVAILAVQRGDPYVSPRVAGGLVKGLRGGQAGHDGQNSISRLTDLTPREREVLQLLAVGKSNKEVASALDISVGTAKKHRENLQRKLGCGSAAELARLAIREGLLEA